MHVDVVEGGKGSVVLEWWGRALPHCAHDMSTQASHMNTFSLMYVILVQLMMFSCTKEVQGSSPEPSFESIG